MAPAAQNILMATTRSTTTGKQREIARHPNKQSHRRALLNWESSLEKLARESLFEVLHARRLERKVSRVGRNRLLATRRLLKLRLAKQKSDCRNFRSSLVNL